MMFLSLRTRVVDENQCSRIFSEKGSDVLGLPGSIVEKLFFQAISNNPSLVHKDDAVGHLSCETHLVVITIIVMPSTLKATRELLIKLVVLDSQVAYDDFEV